MNNKFIFWGVNGYLRPKNELPVKKNDYLCILILSALCEGCKVLLRYIPSQFIYAYKLYMVMIIYYDQYPGLMTALK